MITNVAGRHAFRPPRPTQSTASQLFATNQSIENLEQHGHGQQDQVLQRQLHRRRLTRTTLAQPVPTPSRRARMRAPRSTARSRSARAPAADRLRGALDRQHPSRQQPDRTTTPPTARCLARSRSAAPPAYRQITNVADGTQAQDAVTVRQLSGRAAIVRRHAHAVLPRQLHSCGLAGHWRRVGSGRAADSGQRQQRRRHRQRRHRAAERAGRHCHWPGCHFASGGLDRIGHAMRPPPGFKAWHWARAAA